MIIAGPSPAYRVAQPRSAQRPRAPRTAPGRARAATGATPAATALGLRRGTGWRAPLGEVGRDRGRRRSTQLAREGVLERGPAPVGAPAVLARRAVARQRVGVAPLGRRAPGAVRLPRAVRPRARGLRTSAAGGLAGQRQRDLALRVDVVDADLDLLAEVDDVLDPLDPLALAELARCAAGRRARAGC